MMMFKLYVAPPAGARRIAGVPPRRRPAVSHDDVQVVYSSLSLRLPTDSESEGPTAGRVPGRQRRGPVEPCQPLTVAWPPLELNLKSVQASNVPPGRC